MSSSVASPPPVHAYKGRPPGESVLHRVVRLFLAPFVAFCERHGRPLMGFVRREFELFLECGDPALYRFTVECPRCGYKKEVPPSCKRRGFCPTCGRRRMVDRAAFLVEHVIGNTPVRHYTLSFPPPLRYSLAFNAPVVTKILHAYMNALFGHLRRKAKKVLGLSSVQLAHPGAITGIQRSSCDLRTNCHLHSLVTDGVFVRETPDGPTTFHLLPPPTHDELADIAWETCRRTRDILNRCGYWRDVEDHADDTPSVAIEAEQTHRRTIHGFLSLGPRSAHRVVRFFGAAGPDDDDEPPPHQAAYSFDLHAGRADRSGDRAKLEEMAQYILSPPLIQGRLELGPDDQVVLHLKRPRRDGTRKVTFGPLEFMQRLTALIPVPRANTVRFHGVFASNARLRKEVVPHHEETTCRCEGEHLDEHARSRRLTLAELLAHSHAIDLLRCPQCSSRMEIIPRFSADPDAWDHPAVKGLPPDPPHLLRPPVHASMTA